MIRQRQTLEPGLRMVVIAAVLGLILLTLKAPGWAYAPCGFGLGFSAASAKRAIRP